jgi:hypothetical protein
MDEVQKPSDSECYTPSSEPFRIYLNLQSRPDNAILSERLQVFMAMISGALVEDNNV